MAIECCSCHVRLVILYLVLRQLVVRRKNNVDFCFPNKTHGDDQSISHRYFADGVKF
jgi:hypothetical protein